MANYVLGISGGSGAPYALGVLKGLLEADHDVFLVITPAGRRVLEIESDILMDGSVENDRRMLLDSLPIDTHKGELEVLETTDFSASIASGSFSTARATGTASMPSAPGTCWRPSRSSRAISRTV